MTRSKPDGKVAADLLTDVNAAPQADDSATASASDTKQSDKAPTTSPVNPSHLFGEIRHSPEQIRDLFRNGTYPYKTKIKTAVYDLHKEELQVELLKVQNWVKQTGQRIIGIFEGRDAAGKGGTIKRFMEHLNPRAARVVALEKPTDN